MNRVWVKKRESPPAAAPTAEQTVRRQLSWAAGAESFQNRDPLYHITESFQQTFDAIGRRHGAQLADTAASEEETGEAPDPTSARPFFEDSGREGGALLSRFSETAFQRGTLSAAVLRGTGQMMLFSCLKKTVGQSQPDKWQQRKLFQTASPERNVPGHSPDRVLFNRGFTDSAVGLVVDTLRDARRVVDEMTDLVRGGSEMGKSGTLLKMYPFLDDSRERELLNQYRRQLKGLGPGDPTASVLHNAIVRAEALIAKKAQMKLAFINKLRFLSDRATEALAELEAPGAAEALYGALREAEGAETPEEGDEDGKGDADASPGGDNPGEGADPGAEKPQ
ncbi:hypothetical protein SDC9_68207 [bioreactor metagenome]|uniref:Uncharacterized protein n=1 Tax=bioreactor metagenome TaxID=1076179 RepID=A0A644XZS1_9ZZZZ|nr:hypothetical protein [Oscillibacter sp.]